MPMAAQVSAHHPTVSRPPLSLLVGEQVSLTLLFTRFQGFKMRFRRMTWNCGTPKKH